jgi:DNA-binding SARP family transcriptional activator/tetratricopeptide (TPR) repeat protein
MEIRLLGPLEVHGEAGVVELGGGKQKALLADLAIHRREPLAADRLIDDLWGEQAPPTAGKTLQALISRLRKALGRDAVRLEGGGYVLNDDGLTTDVEELERLLRGSREAGDGVGPSDSLRAALALFRGRPLADFAYDDFAQGEIARLEELRLTTLEERIDDDLACGRQKETLAELEQLVVDHPSRERFRAQLMLALYRSGRQAEALDHYRAARTALLDELGIEPGHALRDLHQAILRQDPSLEAPVAAGAAPAGAPSTFVGRSAELEELVTGLEDAFAGHGRLFLVSGEPGIGKSRLAEELADVARARGATVLVGRSWEAGGAPAYWPWVESLSGFVRHLDEDALASDLGAGVADLAQILPELRHLVPRDAEPLSGESESARFRLFNATRQFLANAARTRPIVLVLDDLHAADAPSLLLLQFLARSLGSTRLLILAAFRDVDPTPREPLMELLAEVTREPTTRRISLSGLDLREVTDYVELTATEIASPGLARSLHERTEGNPLFVAETVRLLAHERAQGDAALTTLAIPPSVRDVILRRLRQLPEECNRALVVASILGRDFDVETLARASDLSVNDLLETLEDAMLTGVVGDMPGAPQRLRFAHVLIRDALYDGLSPGRRVRLHRLVVGTLEARYGNVAGPQLAELAHHSVAGSDFERALDYARRAADRALSQLAYEEAARLYRTALDALDLAAPADALGRCELLLSLGEAEVRAGDSEAAKGAFLAAGDLADALGLAMQFGRAAVGYGGRIVWARAASDARLVPFLEAALAKLPAEELALRSRLLARLAGALRDEPVHERRKALSAEAVDLARNSGDTAALAVALDSRVVSMTPSDPHELQSIADELLEVSTRISDRERTIHAHMNRAYALLQLGEAASARAALVEASRLAEQLRQPTQLWLVRAAKATVALAEGRFDEARELADAARTVGDRSQPADAAAVHVLHRYLLWDLRGEPGDVEATLRDTADLYPARPVFRCALARVHLDRRDAGAATVILDELAADDFAAVTFDPDWLCAMSLLVEAAVALGDQKAAATLYRLLCPFADRVVANIPEPIMGAATRYIGLAAAAIGNSDEAETMFEAALEMNERMGFRPWLARTQEDYARFLQASSRDHLRALDLSRAARETFDQLGMPTRKHGEDA